MELSGGKESPWESRRQAHGTGAPRGTGLWCLWLAGAGGRGGSRHSRGRATARGQCQAHLPGLHPEGSWENEWVRDLEPQKDVGEVLLGPKVGGSGWEAVDGRLGGQVGAWFPC